MLFHALVIHNVHFRKLSAIQDINYCLINTSVRGYENEYS